MPLETGTYLNDLVVTNPAHSDGLNQADSHMRLIKAVLKNSFPGVTAPHSRVITGGAGLILPDGTAVSPAYSFRNEPTLGFYRAAAGALGSSAPLHTPDGTVSLPAYTFAAEPALGFYRSGAGNMAVAGTLRGPGTVPAGALQDFAMPSAPTGWFACDGQSLSTTTYADLFAAIGYTWGGSGGTFFLPNFINRFRRHRDNGSVSGGVGTLQADSLKAHTHTHSGTTQTENAAHAHTFSGVTGVENQQHTHDYDAVAFVSNYASGSSGGNYNPLGRQSTGVENQQHTHNYSGTTAAENANHAHVWSGTTDSTGDTETRPSSGTVLTCIKT